MWSNHDIVCLIISVLGFTQTQNKSTQKKNLFRCGCGCEAGPRDFKNGVKKIDIKYWVTFNYLFIKK